MPTIRPNNAPSCPPKPLKKKIGISPPTENKTPQTADSFVIRQPEDQDKILVRGLRRVSPEVIYYPHYCYDCGCTYIASYLGKPCWSCGGMNIVDCHKNRYSHNEYVKK